MVIRMRYNYTQIPYLLEGDILDKQGQCHDLVQTRQDYRSKSDLMVKYLWLLQHTFQPEVNNEDKTIHEAKQDEIHRIYNL